MNTYGVRRLLLAAPVLGMAFCASSAMATVSIPLSGFSGIGTPVSFEAQFTITGDTLTVVLCNNSTSPSMAPDDVIGSFYFDVVNAGNRPTLTYVSAIGDVYLTDKDGPDTLQTAAANLKAVNAGDNSWQFKPMNAAMSPFLGFGVGTVGNSGLSPNNFNGNIVDGMDYSIYAGDVTTSNLDDKLLVKNCITFTFTGLTGYTEANIATNVAFGLGTAPDSLLTPAPGAAALLGLGGLLAGRRRR